MNTIQHLDKKTFLDWFVKHRKINNRPIEFLLDFLARNKDCLDRFHFVSKELTHDGFSYIKRLEDGTAQFYFIDNGHYYTSPTVLIKDLTLNKDREYFIFFNFEGVSEAFLYNRINVKYDCATTLNEKDLSEIEHFISYQELLNQKRFTTLMIDQAIDNNDKEAFLKLSEELVGWNNELNLFLSTAKTNTERIGV